MPMCSTVPFLLADGQEVADLERLVQRDGQRGEQVAQHVLHRQRDGDAADAEAGDQRRDVDAEVGQQHQEGDDPDQRHADEAQDVEAGGPLGRRLVAPAALLDEVIHRRGAPPGNLQPQDEQQRRHDPAVELIGDGQPAQRQPGGHDHQEQPRGLLEQGQHQLERRGRLLRRQRLDAARDEGPQQRQHGEPHRELRGRDDPGAQVVVQEQAAADVCECVHRWSQKAREINARRTGRVRRRNCTCRGRYSASGPAPCYVNPASPNDGDGREIIRGLSFSRCYKFRN